MPAKWLARASTTRYNVSMAHEVEAKYRLHSFESVRHALRREGAEFLGAVEQTDRFYDLPDRRYHRNGCGLRLRTLEIIDSGSQPLDTRPMITFKGPVKQGALKRRREIETRFDSVDAGLALLPACGLDNVLTVQKRRHSYRLDACLVELDEVPLIGKFAEIEGPDETVIGQMSRRLGLDGEHIPRSYPDMISDRCDELGIEADEITFDRFE